MKRGASLYAWGLALASLLLAAGCSRPRNDAQVVSEVQRHIYSDASIHTRQISIASRHGIVTLNGSVASDPERLAAAADAADIEGVKTVVNNLQVVPATQAQAPAAQPVAPAPAAPTPAAPKEPAAEPVARSGQRTTLTSASPAMPRKSQASAGRLHSARSKVKKSGGQMVAAKTSDASGLPYSIAAPPSSPVGASDRMAHPTAASTAQASVPGTAAATSPTVTPAAAPVVPAPAASSASVTAAAPPAPPKPVTIPSGATISVRLLDRIDTATAHPGDSFRATLNAPLVDESGATVLPQGYEVTGKIVDVKSAGRFAGSSELALQLTQLSVNGKQYSLQTNQYTRQGKSRGKSTAEKVGGGAALGAILGGIFGGAKGAAIGATVGAGAGTGVTAAGRGQQIVLRPETALNFELESPLSVVPSTQSPHGTRSEQRASSASSAGDNSAAAGDGPPVLKRRSQ